MINLITRNVKFENKCVFGFEGSVDNPDQRISTGKGQYYIDFENAIMKGFYEIERINASKNFDGFNRVVINEPAKGTKTPQRIDGNFYNAEDRMEQNRPATGKNALFRDIKDAEEFVKKINASLKSF